MFENDDFHVCDLYPGIRNKMTKKRQKQKENGKLSITQKKAALKVIEDEEAKFGLKPPSQRFLASKISEKLGRLVTHTTVRKLQKEKALIEQQVNQPKKKPFYRLQSNLNWEIPDIENLDISDSELDEAEI